MKTLFKYIISVVILSFFFWYSAQAESLSPPSLTDVIKSNEKQLKLASAQSRFKKNKTATGVLLPIKKSYSYQTIQSGKAITLSKYNEVDLWVQEVDLKKWWHMQSLLTLSGYDASNGEPLFEKKKLNEVESTLSSKPFSIINGQFFDPKRAVTPLSFGVKVDGIVRTAGSDNRNEDKNILILDTGMAKIVPYSWENLRDAPGYIAMVNLSLKKSHYKNEDIGRTYICLKNPNSKNESSSLLIFTAVAMSESVIENELIRWGCTRDSSSKLDSSGSTRLWLEWEYIYGFSHSGNPDYRKIPHSLAIYDGANQS